MTKLFSNISFIGGIHGVGKSTICKTITSHLGIKYLSASEVIKWEEINEDLKNKRVENIGATQNRLLKGLINVVDKKFHYLLDGHFCLLDKSAKISRVPIETFEVINPISLYLITGDINQIKARLEARDNRAYDYDLLLEMQEAETIYAKELSGHLNVSLSFGEQDNYSAILQHITKLTSLR